jgi:type II secretory pathway pseudopilin PulG
MMQLGRLNLPRCYPSDQSKPGGSEAAFTLIELIIAIGLAGLLMASFAGVFGVASREWKGEQLRSDILQNHWAAQQWLKKDIRAARKVRVRFEADALRLELEKPYIQLRSNETSFLNPSWEWVIYSLNTDQQQLQRSIHGSHNPVAQGISAFNCTLTDNDGFATIHITSKQEKRQVETRFQVRLRNLKE